jgi:hypothetical protein
MSSPFELTTEQADYAHLQPGYWGDEVAVLPVKPNHYVASERSKKLAKSLLERYMADEFETEVPVANYNFMPENFAAGSIFAYTIERLKLRNNVIAGELEIDHHGGIILPAGAKNKLYTPVLNPVTDRLRFEDASAIARPLILGTTTISYDKDGSSTLERLKHLRICEASAVAWQEEIDRFKATFKGKLSYFLFGDD